MLHVKAKGKENMGYQEIKQHNFKPSDQLKCYEAIEESTNLFILERLLWREEVYFVKYFSLDPM